MIFNHFSTFVTTLCTIFYKLKKIIAHHKTTSVKYINVSTVKHDFAGVPKKH